MSDRNSKLGWVVAVLALAVIALGVLLYLRTEETHDLEMEKQELTLELDGLKEDLLAQMGGNDSLNSFIEAEVSRLSAVIDSINHVGVENKKLITSYRGTVYRLKNANKELVAQLDSANRAFEDLKVRERLVADSLANALIENQNLDQQNRGLSETVQQGKQLVATAFSIEAVRIARSGNERKTKRASKADRLKVCFTVPENKIADKGAETLYIKWFDTKGKPVDAPGANTGIVGGAESGFNGKTSIKYMGTEMQACIDVNRAEDSPVELPAGIYTVAVYSKDYLMGTGAIELK